MNSLTRILSICVVALALTQAQASTIDLTDYGPQPADRTKPTIEAWLDSLIANYNTAHADLPDPGLRLFRVNSDDATSPAGFPTFSGGTSITLPEGEFDYLTLHWLGPNGGFTQAFYVGDVTTGTITFESPLQTKLNGIDQKQYDLSWYAGFHKVTATPEPAIMVAGVWTLLLLGSKIQRTPREKRVV
jgi:hypothetical protein